MKKTAFLLCALLGACVADTSDRLDAASENEDSALMAARPVYWYLEGPRKSKQVPQEDFAATLVCSNDGKGHAMAQIVLRNVKQNANYYGYVTLVMKAQNASGASGSQTKVFENVELPIQGRSYPITLVSGSYSECLSMTATLSITWTEPV